MTDRSTNAQSRRGRAATVTVAASILLAACTLKSDAQYSAEQSRRNNERALQGLQAATQQTARGSDLAGEALRAAVAGKTLVNRYESGPGNTRGPYVIRRYFAADGRYRLVDDPAITGAPADDAHRWRVDGARLCIMGPPSPKESKCYRMARATDGALQWFIDEPGSPYDRLLTIVTREIVDGPPGR